MTSKANYERAYWKAVEIREKVHSMEIKVPFARMETLLKIYELLSEIIEAPWKQK